ncbi:MAG: hypothetical protein KGJ02_01600 [Verrucomicrobiota bacterium]|nr:hypothetical protein [Verrucomicrobiota bacterium]
MRKKENSKFPLSKSFYIVVASLPHRENLVAEIFYNGVQWVELSQEDKEIMIQFYSHPRQEYWEFPLDEAFAALEEAKKRFIGMGK